MKKTKLIAFLLLCTGIHLIAQEPQVTNAFDDLNRKGEFSTALNDMNKGATQEQMDAFNKELPSCGYFVFTEDRKNEICLSDRFPVSWLQRTSEQRLQLKGTAAPNEYYTFQVAAYAPDKYLEEPQLSFSDLKSKKGLIKSSQIKCFNLEGVNTSGHSFEKKILIPKGKIQPLWIGVSIPKEAKGIYQGVVTLSFKNAPSQQISVKINVEGKPVINKGYDEGWRKSRLNWLDSKIALSDIPTHPYVDIQKEGHKISYLGGFVELDRSGLPLQITTHYNGYGLLDKDTKNNLLSSSFRFIIETDYGVEQLVSNEIEFKKQSEGKIEWESKAQNSKIELLCEGSFSFDGFITYSLQVKSLCDVNIQDIRLEVPFLEENAKYMMGLNQKGGVRPDHLHWVWDVTRHQDKIWMGDVDAGLNFCFMDQDYVRPLVNIYYALGPLHLPKSWGNEQKGGISIDKKSAEEVLLKAYSGKRAMKKGEKLYYNFNLLVTPVKPIDIKQSCEERFYHSNSDVSSHYLEEAVKKGANNINIHHKKDIYPFINYPYYDESAKDLKDFIQKAHRKDVKVRAYYTTRELTVKVPEFWALRSMGDEIFMDGPGSETRTLIHRNGPHQWLKDHLKDHFVPAWYNAFNEGKYKGDMDLSIITTPDSRWNNYYLEGLNWMVQQLKLDGVYIDDSALDRNTLQRARRILDADNHTRLIDLHSWNHYNKHAGFANSLHLYLELLPYIDRTWIGEGFSDDSTPDFWLVEMSGRPFGTISESLQTKNVYKGMVYGMLPRLPWSGDPTPLWKLQDSFGMKEAKMCGWWSDLCPVKTVTDGLKYTVYLKDDKALIVVANWTKESVTTDIQLDEKLLGFHPSSFSLPEIGNGIQEAKDITSLRNIKIPADKGLFILIKK